jgi:hypothetical protein
MLVTFSDAVQRISDHITHQTIPFCDCVLDLDILASHSQHWGIYPTMAAFVLVEKAVILDALIRWGLLEELERDGCEDSGG